jgi:hypothetical protein
MAIMSRRTARALIVESMAPPRTRRPMLAVSGTRLGLIPHPAADLSPWLLLVEGHQRTSGQRRPDAIARASVGASQPRKLQSQFLRMSMMPRSAPTSSTIWTSVANSTLVTGRRPNLHSTTQKLLDTCPRCADGNVYVMLTSHTFEAFIYIGIHAEGAEEVCGSFLVVVPRRHASSVPLMPHVRPQASR